MQGVLKDAETGRLISGATLSTTVTRISQTSDNEGAFRMMLVDDDSLIITHISYDEQRIQVKGVNFITIKMQRKSIVLDNLIINTGYQHLDPNKVNGSYEVIDNKMINQQTTGNVLDRLKGVTNGLLFNVGKRNTNPQNSTNLTIRGLSTIDGPLDPLIVVNNFIYDGNIDNINPNDVESVTILKDAASASIWGARAANGVIVITLKSGKFNQPLKIDFNSNVVITEKPDLFSQSTISVADFIEFEQALYQAGYFKSMFTNRNRPAIPPAVQIFEDRKNGLITADDSLARIDLLKQIDNRKQFTNYFYQKGITHQSGVNISGGNDNISWLLAGGYNNSSSNLRAKSEQINLMLENSYAPVKNLKISVSASYVTSNSTSGIPEYENIVSLNNATQVPYLSLTGINGSPVAVPKDYNIRYTDTAGAGKLMDWNYYPLTDYTHSSTKTHAVQTLANLSAAYAVTKGISVSILGQYGNQQTQADFHADTASYYARNLINNFSQIDGATGVIHYIVPKGDILKRSSSSLISYNMRAQITIARKINHHSFNAIAGVEVRSWSNSGYETTFYGYNPDPLTYYTQMDYSVRYPQLIGGTTSTASSGISMYSTKNNFLSEFANASYYYREKYSLSGNMRRDGANIFGVHTNEKWKPLWSVGAGWNLAREDFYSIKWMHLLRFSITYGVSGNVDISKSAVPVAQLTVLDEYPLPFLQILRLNNPSLSWEQSHQTNLRVDFGTLNSFLTGSLEYYLKRGSQLYGPMPYDYTAWGTLRTIIANAANMKGRGIDVSLRSKNIDRKFKWNTSYILNYNYSEVTDYFSGTETTTSRLIGSRGASIFPVVGKPLYAIAAYKWGGLDENGNPMGYLDGNLSIDYNAIAQSAAKESKENSNYKYIGPATPSFYGSLLNEFIFRKFAFTVNVTYKAGYYLFKPALAYTSLAKNGVSGVDYENRWQHPGDEKTTNVPSYIYPLNERRDEFYNAAEINVIKGDHIRLQFVNLSYTVLKDQKFRAFKNLDIYFNASNLGILWRSNKENIDPDFPGIVPNPKNYTIGVRSNF